MANADRHTAGRVVNPQVGDDYFDSSSTPNAYDDQTELSSSSTQPTVNDGRVKGVRTADISSGLLNGVIAGYEPLTKPDTGNKLTNISVSGFAELSNFAFLKEGHYIMRRVTDLINDEAAGGNSANLRSAGSNYLYGRRSIHQVESVRTSRVATAIREGQWIAFSGQFQPGHPVDANDIGTWETIGTDDAANPTQFKPGELTYQHGSGGGIPLRDDYKPKTNW